MTIKIGPMDLNSFTNMSKELRQEVCDYLHELHDSMLPCTDKNETLLFGLEYVLQGLGAEGYEFS